MNRKDTIDELFSKIHQLCCLEYENNKKSINYVKPIISAMSNLGFRDSRTLLANMLLDENDDNFDFAKTLYLESISDGDTCAMYNLYISYAEKGDHINAYKFYKMARENNFPFALEQDFMKYSE